MFKKVAFTMYPVADMARARHFYEETLGIKVGKVSMRGAGGWVEYDLPGGGCFCITTFTKSAPSTSGGTISFEVEDIEHLVGDLKAKGVTFVSEMIQSPVCRMAVCLDSEGNSLLLHQLKPKEAEASTAG